jgi:vacuolar iron transporter family protein
MVSENVARKFCAEEHKSKTIYNELAKWEKDAGRRKILQRLAAQEEGHYRFWKKYAGEYEPGVSGFYVKFIVLLRTVFGLTFTLKLLERHENNATNDYRALAASIPRADRKAFMRMIKDEIEHEKYFLSQINESVLKYMSFIVLGLSDAIVEITGVHTGFLGVTSSTLIAGIAGLVVGFAAAISMASAAYLQAKQDTAKPPVKSAIATGIAYFAAVVLLATPYFFIRTMIEAFAASLIAALVLMAAFIFYSSVINEKSFRREYVESAVLILATSILAFLFGEFLGAAFGVSQFIR